MLAKSKLNSIETLISQALFDMDISHKKFVTILNEKDKYERMKDNLKSRNETFMSNNISWKQCIKLWDGEVWNQRFKRKIIVYFMSSKKKNFFSDTI